MAVAGSLTLTPGAAFGCGSSTEEPANAYRVLQESASEQANNEDEAPPENTPPENAPPEGPDERESGRASSEQSEPAGDDALVVVDRDHGLPEEYEPEDLVKLPDYGVPTVKDREMRLREEAAKALSDLTEDANAAGVELVVGSAYRSHEHQIVSYENWTAVFGEEESGFSAPPGHSEHQLGTAADFTNAAAGYELGQWFSETGAADWLRQNAARYGFIMSYPRDAREQTGYRWEPWHYRYIGAENAARYEEGDYESPRQFLLEEGVRPPSPDESRTRPASSGNEILPDYSGPRGAG